MNGGDAIRDADGVQLTKQWWGELKIFEVVIVFLTP